MITQKLREMHFFTFKYLYYQISQCNIEYTHIQYNKLFTYYNESDTDKRLTVVLLKKYP